MARRFLAMGECMVELAPLEAEGHYQRRFAGDTFNTAWYTAQLSAGTGLEVSYLTAVGQDDISDDMLAFMEGSGVQPIAARRADRTLGLYMISLVKGERSFAYWRSQAAARTFVDDLDALPGLESGDVAYFSGITLGILTADRREKLLSLLAEARARGVILAFDMNLRPKLWDSTETMCAAVEEAAGVADMVFPSFDDEAQFFGDASPEATARRYLALGAKTAVVRNGPDPVLIATAESQSWIEPAKVPEIVDTTAAGDSFNGGFFAKYLNGASVEDAARYGCEIAGKVIAQRGALVSL